MKVMQKTAAAFASQGVDGLLYALRSTRESRLDSLTPAFAFSLSPARFSGRSLGCISPLFASRGGDCVATSV